MGFGLAFCCSCLLLVLVGLFPVFFFVLFLFFFLLLLLPSPSNLAAFFSNLPTHHTQSLLVAMLAKLASRPLGRALLAFPVLLLLLLLLLAFMGNLRVVSGEASQLPWPQYRRFSNRSGVAHALSFQLTPAIKWQYEPRDGVVDGSFAVSNTALYFGTSTGSVHALSTSNGASIWNATLGGAVVSTPCLVLQGTFVIVTARDGVVYKLDANHGFVSWRDQTDAAITASPLLLDDENVVVV